VKDRYFQGLTGPLSVSGDGSYVASTAWYSKSLGGGYSINWSVVYLAKFPGGSLVKLDGLADPTAKYGQDKYPTISGDARYIAFQSARGGQNNWDVLLYDRNTKSLVSLPGLNSASDDDRLPGISSDGRCIAFSSPRTMNGHLFVYERDANSLALVPGLFPDYARLN
jgi:Tol biopolymer transport system component